ncbi:response regulator transcription factor [Pseudonocardia nematodicida]|uniref:Response regulator transcription factor n=1 Tax=Pseudonocardia nematodicida TaxID=1206997 RepID=A0ABV1KEM2_9PSEU
MLVVDPDTERAAHLAQELGRHEIRSAVTASAIEALHRYSEVDIVLLDLDLPDRAGFDLCRSLVALSGIPIIAMTARPEEVDRVLGLQAGADDCVVRPVGLYELRARIDAVLRRFRSGAPPIGAGTGGLSLDPVERRVRVGDAEVELSRKEFDMLHMLVRAGGGVVSRSRLLREVWDGSYSRRTIDTHVNSVRNKLGDAAWIETVRGVGYRMGRP